MSKTMRRSAAIKPQSAIKANGVIKSDSVHIRHAADSNGSRANGMKANGVVKHASAKANGKAAFGGAPHMVERRPTARQLRIAERIQRVNAERERLKDLSGSFTLAKSKRKPMKDRLVLMVRDS